MSEVVFRAEEAPSADPSAATADPAFLRDVLAGLATEPKAIPARWFYDRTGSELFEAITQLPEYYPTRAEAALLRTYAAEVGDIAGHGRAVIEFGSGSSVKTPLLLEAIAPSAYVPIDISGPFLREAAAGLAARFPGLPVLPVEADFTGPVPLPRAIEDSARLGFFPGSTIGNLAPADAVDLLRGMATLLGIGAMLLIGMDLVKGADVLIPAYDDAAGVTARFNLNLLHRINRELDGDVPVETFAHEARWNEAASRIEMHLVATRDATFTVAGRRFAMRAGETIHSENSHKYGRRSARTLLSAGSWTPLREWADQDGLFLLMLAEARPKPIAP